jgi:hypothetical protein
VVAGDSVRNEIDAAFNPVLRFFLAAQGIHQFLRLTRGSPDRMHELLQSLDQLTLGGTGQHRVR